MLPYGRKLTYNHATYGSHSLATYAYTQFVSTTTGWYKSYVKVCDSWVSRGRYLDLATLVDGKAKMRVIQ